jgi:hypothetical protein
MSALSNNDSSMGGGGYGACAGFTYGGNSNYNSGSVYGSANHYVTDEEESPEGAQFMGMMRSGGSVAVESFATSEFQPFGFGNKGACLEQPSSNLSFSNPQEFRLAAEKAHPYIITHSNLTFDQIPSVTGVPIRRQFFAPRKYLSPSNFETDKTWEIIEGELKEYFDANAIPYCLPDTIAVFSVSGISSDSNLIFDIHVCPAPKQTESEQQKFVIEFRRVRGDAFILSKIFLELKSRLVPAGQEEEEAADDEEDLALGSSMQYTIPPVEKSRYSGEYFNFDALIK